MGENDGGNSENMRKIKRLWVGGRIGGCEGGGGRGEGGEEGGGGGGDNSR